MTMNTNTIGNWDGEQLDPVEFLTQAIRVMREVREIGLGLDMTVFVDNYSEDYLDDYSKFVDEVRNPSCGTACCGIGWLGSDAYFNSIGLYLDSTDRYNALRPFIKSGGSENSLFACTEEFSGLNPQLFWSLFEADSGTRRDNLMDYCEQMGCRDIEPNEEPKHYHSDENNIDDLIDAIHWVIDTFFVEYKGVYYNAL
jgi:hypothetical protein